MFIKAKFILQDDFYLEYYDLDELINNIIENENKTMIYIKYWNLKPNNDYYACTLPYEDLIYIDSYYEYDDEIYCNIYLDDNIDDYFDRKLEQYFRNEDEFDLILEWIGSSLSANICTLTNAKGFSESIIQ